MSPKTSFAIRYSIALSALTIVGWFVGKSFEDDFDNLFLN